MSKCIVNNDTLLKIRAEVASLMDDYDFEGWSKGELINEFDNYLKSTTQYDINKVKLISEAILDTVQSYGVQDIAPDIFKLSYIETRIRDLNNNIQINDKLDRSIDQIQDVETVKNIKAANREFLNKAYGLATEVRTYMERDANQSLYDCLFVSRGHIPEIALGLVNTTADLNRNIRTYQQLLVNRIVNYFNNLIAISPNLSISQDLKVRLNTDTRLYDQDNKLTDILDILQPLIDQYLSPENLDSQNLRDLYSIIINDDRSVSAQEKNNAKLRLDAYNSNVLLKHFDEYLYLVSEGTVDIKDFGIITGENKYAINPKTARVHTNWREDDDVNAEKEADYLTKWAINTTPLYRWQGNNQVAGRYLNYADFQHLVAKLKVFSALEAAQNLIFDDNYKYDQHSNVWDSLSDRAKEVFDGKSLANVIDTIRLNPRKYLDSIFELFSSEQFYNSQRNGLMSDKLFTNDELDKLYSLNKGIFSEQEANSLRVLSPANVDGDYYSNITNTANSIYKNTLIQYYQDGDNLVIRTLIDSTVHNLRRELETTINSRNSTLYRPYDELTEDLNPSYVNGQFSYTIPNTKYTVTLENGIVRNPANLNWENIKYLVDQVLGTNFSYNPDFRQLLQREYGGSESELVSNMLNFVSRVLYRQHISNLYKDSPNRQIDLANALGQNNFKWDSILQQINLIDDKDIPTLRRIARAKANLQGITTAVQVKDSQGKSQSLQTLSRLMGSYRTQWVLQEQTDQSATNRMSIFDPGLLEDVVVMKEYYSPGDNSKDATKWNVSEMSYAGFVNDFIGGLVQREETSNSIVGNGHCLFLASVNSDKGQIDKLLINLNKQSKNGKTYLESTPDDIRSLIKEEFGQFYTKIYNNVVQDLRILEDYILQTTNTDINGLLSADYLYNFENFNAQFDTLLTNIYPRIWNTFKVERKLLDNPAKFIKFFTLQYNKQHRLHPLALIDQIHYVVDKKGNLLANKSFIAQIARFNPQFIYKLDPDFNFSEYTNERDFWNLKNKDVLKSLLKSNFKVNTSKITAENTYLRQYKEWINKSGNVILAKIKINGRWKDIASSNDLYGYNINDIIDRSEIQLNPLIDKYNVLDYFFTHEWQATTVGSFIAHPNKSKADTILQEEAGRFQAQHKRNVSYTAQVHEFQLGKLNGIPTYYNIATVDDILDFQGTINGVINKIKPFDGATFVNPFIVYLENYSLDGSKAGITKKQFVHFKDERTGTGGIIKTAGFGLTNDWIRNSKLLQNMMLKMTKGTWITEDEQEWTTNILKDYNGRDISYTGFNKQHTNLYFKRDGHYYIISDIQSLGNNRYNRVINEVTGDGIVIDDTTQIEENILVNSNYALWNLFGGMNSMELQSNKLVPSEISIENVVIAMNNLGIPKNINIETQDDIWQPLKNSDIHYLVTAGAIKQGAANINSAHRYTDNQDLDIQRIRMLQAGIQLDKEHHADDAELSLMTQVISACASRGFTFEVATKLYEALRGTTEIGCQKYFNTIESYFADESSDALYTLIINSIIDSLSDSNVNTSNFASKVADKLKKKADEGIEIDYKKEGLPLSDNTVYAKFLSTIAVYLTNSGIKQKIQGVLSVLTPSHNIYKLYAGRKLESFDNLDSEIAELQSQQVPTFDINYRWTRDMTTFMGMSIEVAKEKGALISTDGTRSVGMKNINGTTIQIDPWLLRDLYNRKAWKNPANSEPLDIEFNTFDDFLRFCFLHEAMHNQFKRTEQETAQQYETRINNEALKRFDNNISNLELERYYIVTSVVDQEVENSDGTIDVLPIETEEIVYIGTPTDYKRLKQRVQSGEIIRVTESLKEGRDLSGYNVRFKDSNGTSFQLYDLDSVQALFTLQDLKNKYKGDLLNTYAQNLYQELTGRQVTSNAKQIETLIRRYVQYDILNLSKFSGDTMQQYQTLLNSREDSQGWYDKYACWVNAKLGTGYGDRIQTDYGLVKVKSENFEIVEQQVRKRLEQVSAVKIDGEYHTIDKNSVNISPYEVIMGKRFATIFGLDEYADVAAISADPDYFVKQFIHRQESKISSQYYTLELKLFNGDHKYLATPEQVAGLRKLDSTMFFTENGHRYRQDIKGNVLYEVEPDVEIYIAPGNVEVIVPNNFKFYLDNLSYDAIKVSPNVSTNWENIRQDIQNSTNETAQNSYKDLTRYGQRLNEVLLAQDELFGITLDNYKELGDQHSIIRRGRAIHTSFLKSLDIVATRTPSQSMQSFMPMKVVAFENRDVNNAYVSTFQILLQGSDYDIDTGSLATYDIGPSGIIELWSPYANISNIYLLNASMELPTPTGNFIEFNELPKNTSAITFLDIFNQLFTIRIGRNYYKSIDQVTIDRTNLDISLNLDTPENIRLFGQMINSIDLLHNIDDQSLNQFIQNIIELHPDLEPINQLSFSEKRMAAESIIKFIIDTVNKHNTYYNNISRSKIVRITNNLAQYSMYTASADPSNLIESQTSVDTTTGPLKAKAEESEEAKAALNMTVANVFNKFESIRINMIGKDDIGVCAIGLKSFFGLTQYCNYLLNNGTYEEQKRILLNGGKGVQIGNNVYKTIANIRSVDPNTVTNYDVLKAISQVTNDEDAAIVLSALLSLATDNAKELSMSKLNASTGMLGLYVYGISIGMNFNDIGDIIMSDLGSTIMNLLEGDVYNNIRGFSNVAAALDYLEKKGPRQSDLNKFSVRYDSNGVELAQNPLHFFTSRLFDHNKSWITDIYENKKLSDVLLILSKTNNLKSVIGTLEAIRNEYKIEDTYAQETYNQLIDYVETFIIQANKAYTNSQIAQDLRELAKGAETQRRLGRILSYNQGIKTSGQDFSRQLNEFERCIYDEDNSAGQIIDVVKFAFDANYREECIKRYDELGNPFNILDVVARVPHFLGYIKVMAATKQSFMQSFKFRSVRNLSPLISKKMSLKDEQQITKGIQNFVGDYIRKEWMKYKGLSISIPKGSKYFTSNGEMYEAEAPMKIELGTDWGDATFRLYMEGTIIPNLKKGVIGSNKSASVKSNLFIQDMVNNVFNLTTSRNPILVYTLPINMLPRTSYDREVFNRYKAEFNKLSEFSYQNRILNSDRTVFDNTSIPLTDLITYYSMIAYSWKLGEKSLVSILEDFQNISIIEDFHNFETEIDKSGFTLDDNFVNDIIPYVAPHANPYSSFVTYIYSRLNNKYVLMSKNLEGGYDASGAYLNSNFFTRGFIEQDTKYIPTLYKEGEKDIQVGIFYNTENKNISQIIVDGKEINLEEYGLNKQITQLLFTKKDGNNVVDIDTVISIIRNKNNPC